MIAERTHVHLHDQPILDAHARHFHQHMPGETFGILAISLTLESSLEDFVGFDG